MPETHTISVVVEAAANPTPEAPYQLSLSDDEGNSGINNITTKAKPGDTIVWNISTQLTDSVSLSNIYKKPGTTVDVFSTEPAAVPDSNNMSFSGVISSTITTEEIESYNIDYYVGANKYTDDPKMDIDPDA